MRRWVLLITAVCFFGSVSVARCTESEILKEIEQLKQRIAQLEERLEQQEAEESSQRDEAASGTTATDVLGEKFGSLSIHGGVVGYYQGASKSKIGGNHSKPPRCTYAGGFCSCKLLEA